MTTSWDYAGAIRRFFAFAADVVLLLAIIFGLEFGGGFLLAYSVGRQDNFGHFVHICIRAIFNFWDANPFILLSIIAFSYYVAGECSALQATLGKRLLGLRVRRNSDPASSLGAFRAGIRTLAKFTLPAALFFFGEQIAVLVGYTGAWQTLESDDRIDCAVIAFFASGLTTFMLPRKQAVHDLIAGSVVVRSGRSNTILETIMDITIG